MKAKLVIAIVVGLVACKVALAQTNSADEKPVSAPTPPAAVGEPAAVPDAPVAAEDKPAGAATPPAAAEEKTAVANVAPVVLAAADSRPAGAPLRVAAAEPKPDAEPTSPGTAIPLIQFQDVSLTTAIENLARQANLNYILDPKVGYGLPDDKTGAVKVEPKISVRWENLTAEQALMGLLSTHGLQIVDDPKNKISRVTLKDPAAKEPLLTRVIQLKFASPSNVLSAVVGTLTDARSKVVPDTRTSQLVLLATEKEVDSVDKLIASLDLQTKEVLIEAKILETTLNPKTSKGIDWSGTLKNQNFAFGNNAPATIPATPPISYVDPTTGIPTTLPGTPAVPGGILSDPKVLWNSVTGFNPANAFLNADGLNAALSFLNESGDTKVVSEPRIVTLDNQKATIEVGLLFPIVNTTASTANTTAGSAISYSNLTVNLDVTPRITANNFIELKIQQAVFRLGPTVPSTVGGVNNQVNSFFSRKLDTSVLIPSGNTLVMGGLIQDTKLNGNVKVPLLGDIPVFGLLFRKDSKSLDRQNLTVFITPTVVQDGDFQPSQTGYLKTTGKEEVKEDWSAWDSGKPKNWSKQKSDTSSN